MSNSASINSFIKWIQSFDNRLLKNEDDVEKNLLFRCFSILVIQKDAVRVSIH